MMNWLIAAQLFFGLDPHSMSAVQAGQKLRAQGFIPIRKPQSPDSNASTSELMDGLASEIKWIGFRSYDLRFEPRSAQSEIAYVDLYPCPSTGGLAEVQIVYKSFVPLAKFGEMSAKISKTLGIRPKMDSSSSGKSLTVTWPKAGSNTTAAHWIKGGPPSIQILGSRENIHCRLSFNSVADPSE